MTRLSFPGDPLPIRAEMYISGTWTDVTSRVREDREIVISGRGRANEQGRPSPTTCDFTVNNRDGLFNNRNPNSAYYGLLPRNLPVRFSVTEDRSFLVLDTADTSRLKTTDKASLDIVGDIDVRAEFSPGKWTGGQYGYVLASKYRRTASANRSWILCIHKNGYAQFQWTTDGTTATLAGASSTVPIDMTGGSIAVRATLDVDNGAAGHTVTFYTAATISDSWTILGSAVVTAGVTSIFSGTGELELGRIDDGVNLGVNGLTGLTGRLYAFQMYNGIAGTLVANADIYNRARGTTSFSDGLTSPNTWTVEGTAEITPDDRRFTGEISSLPIEADLSGRDIYVPVQAADVTRRLGKGAVSIASALKSFFSPYLTGVQGGSTGYWTCEDGSAATSLSNSNPRGVNGSFTDVTFGTASDLPASAGTVTINSTSSSITVTGRTFGNTGYSCFNFAMQMSALPASSVTLLDATCTSGTIGRINFSVSGTAYDLTAYDTDGTVLATSSTSWTTSTPPTVWNLFRIQLSQSGANVNLDLGWYHPGDTVLVGITTLTFAATAGRFYKGQITGATQNIGTRFAHLFMGQFFLDNTTQAYVDAANAFVGETTATRWARICAANGILSLVVGDTTNCEPMNAQPIDTPLNVLYDCLETERGQVYPDRGSLALVFRTRASLINQYGPSISHTGGEIGPPRPKPTDDDGLLRNAVTATRFDGSTGYATQDTGPNSTASPTASPPGVGTVTGQIIPNPELSERLRDMAAHEVFLGTWDEPRWPLVQVLLERANYTGTATKVSKAYGLSRLDVGDLLNITNLPAYLPPDTVTLMVQGITEVLGNRSWRLAWNTSPYGPYILNDLTSLSASRYRVAAGSAGYVLAGGMTTTALSFTLTVPTGSTLWGTTLTKPGNFPQNVVVAGEVMTVSAISGTSSPQTFTVSARSVNGVVKAHSAGEAVEVQYPFNTGL